MFIVRMAKTSDLESLYELSKLVSFINLPRDKEYLEKLISSSTKSFKAPSQKKEKNNFLFILEDLNNKKVIGASLIHAKHGTPDEPHFFLKVSQEHKYSKTMNTGFIHGTLKLGYDTDGPTEIGALVIHPSYRGHKERLGKFLSFSRFLFMGLNEELFEKTVHAELMPPLDKDGNSPLWEAIGRRFMNMDYQEADLLSRSNKEFILALYPSENIYQTLLPISARDAIGKVGEQTLGVQKMLEKIGFSYTNEVDPFDGGPHYRSEIKSISIVKNTKEFKIASFKDLQDDQSSEELIIAPKDTFFKSVKTKGIINTDKMEIELSREVQNYDFLELGASIYVSLMD